MKHTKNWATDIRARFLTPWSVLPDHNSLTLGPELVLFDLDGTLIDSVPDLAAAVDYMLRQLGRDEAGVERVATWVGNGADKLVRRALADGDEWLAQRLDSQEVTAARQHFDQAYLEHLHHATGLYDGVEALLQQLQSGLSRHLALVTNKPRMFTEPLLASLGWQDTFDCVVCGDDLDEKKPSPKPLLHICQQLDIQPAQALMIGDSRNDVMAARLAGIPIVAVSYGYNHGEDIVHSEPDWIIQTLPELFEE